MAPVRIRVKPKKSATPGGSTELVRLGLPNPT